jgi:hypothetical protein
VRDQGRLALLLRLGGDLQFDGDFRDDHMGKRRSENIPDPGVLHIMVWVVVGPLPQEFDAALLAQFYRSMYAAHHA